MADRGRAEALFDTTGRIRRPRSRALLRELWDLATYAPTPPDPAGMPPGNGHVILVVPGFLTGDAITRPLRDFLTACGYRVFGWELGLNLGPLPATLAGLEARLRSLAVLEGGPISLVGVSLGGTFARDLAHSHPSLVRHAITLVSPVKLPTASTLDWLVRLFMPFWSKEIDLDRLAASPGLPTTALYTHEDGVLAWESCIGEDAEGTAFRITGRHMTICRNPQTLRVVACRLAEASSTPGC